MTSLLETIGNTALEVFEAPLTQQGLSAALTALAGPYAPIVMAAAHGVPAAVALVKRLSAGETISPEEAKAAWPAIQAEAKQVGLDWDASERAKG